MRSLCLFASILILLAFKSQNQFSFPSFWPEPVYPFSQNPLSQAKVDLGRMLFYDPILSRDSSISCQSCHLSYTAFAHTDHALSHGIQDRIGKRNAPALQNLAWNATFMWDGAIHHLDFQALGPISQPDEMGESLENVIRKLKRTQIYPKAFQKAFGNDSITGEKVLKSVSAFLLSLVSQNSRYDSMRLGQIRFNAQEIHGYQLYRRHCSACHTEPLFTNGGFERNGLASDPILKDSGRYTVTHKLEDQFRFKVPSLRNLRYSFPYFHDGRTENLREAVRHYSRISRQSLSRPVPGLVANPDSISDLLAFLQTLNDPVFVRNPSHSYPHQLFSTSSPKP